MPKTLVTLQQLIQLRARGIKELSGQLSSQKQLNQRYENNIQALQKLSVAPADASSNAAMMINQAHYKKNIQRIINWQKQEQALAQLKTRQLQDDLLAEARRERRFQLALEQRREGIAIDEGRKAQKATDAISAQCWLRRHRAT
ncbi:flagellar export protein FliJ [Enterobacteriaceae bacterium RIT714]|nr:flagellar export protein FliJ [Enterobacteriaceae bacterium RIT714]